MSDTPRTPASNLRATTAELRNTIHEHLERGEGAAAFDMAVTLWDADAGPANAGLLLRAATADARPRTPLEIFIARSFTVEPIVPVLRAAGARYGLDLSVRVGDFNAYAQELLAPGSAIYAQKLDALVLALQTQDVSPRLWDGDILADPAALEAEVARIATEIESLLVAFRSRSTAPVILHLLDAPKTYRQGILDQQVAFGQADAIIAVNQRLREACRRVGGVFALDYGDVIARHGRDAWRNERNWLTSRLPVSGEFLAGLAQEWIRYLVPLSGRVAKALVVDLDNTLWGGVIGEDGLSGIVLSREVKGAAFHQVQQAVKDLARRGILLAICSKNNEADALEVFAQHPEMVLTLDDFAVRRINWKTKSENLREIAAELNIGIDAIAFLDDNPVERQQVRAAIPEAIVLQYPEKPDTWATRLLTDPRFERLTITDEDRQRTAMYRTRAAQADAATGFGSHEEFLRSLQQSVRLEPLTSINRARIAQLTQKTNQFNVTTRRYTEQDLLALLDRGAIVLGAHVSDRFGDHGLVAVVIAVPSESRLQIDTFLMSCRVIGRGVETAVLAAITQMARARHFTHVDGTFKPTAKNAPARDFFSTHHFELATSAEDESNWTLELAREDVAVPFGIELTLTELTAT